MKYCFKCKKSFDNNKEECDSCLHELKEFSDDKQGARLAVQIVFIVLLSLILVLSVYLQTIDINDITSQSGSYEPGEAVGVAFAALFLGLLLVGGPVIFSVISLIIALINIATIKGSNYRSFIIGWTIEGLCLTNIIIAIIRIVTLNMSN